jgi:hypothetical protein
MTDTDFGDNIKINLSRVKGNKFNGLRTYLVALHDGGDNYADSRPQRWLVRIHGSSKRMPGCRPEAFRDPLRLHNLQFAVSCS